MNAADRNPHVCSSSLCDNLFACCATVGSAGGALAGVLAAESYLDGGYVVALGALGAAAGCAALTLLCSAVSSLFSRPRPAVERARAEQRDRVATPV